MNKIVNLTPHVINVVSPEGETLGTFAPSGAVARLATTNEPAGSVGGVPLTRTVFGEPIGLPTQEDGTILIVSGLVRGALPGRSDLASPGWLVRDDAGRVVGCEGLIIN